MLKRYRLGCVICYGQVRDGERSSPIAHQNIGISSIVMHGILQHGVKGWMERNFYADNIYLTPAPSIERTSQQRVEKGREGRIRRSL